MTKRKWTIVAGAIAAAAVLLIGLGYGVSQIAAQERGSETVPARGQPWGRGRAYGTGDAMNFGWQTRGQAEVIAEVLGMDVEDLVAELRDGRSVAEVAEERGVALDEVVEALLELPQERLAEAVADGRLTQEEADERLVEIEEHMTERLQEPGLAVGQMGPAGMMWRAERFGWQTRGQAEVVAEVLGMDVEDLVAELRDERSVAEVAEERGVALDEVVEALLELPQERLAEAVAGGRLTQEEADERLVEIEEHMTERLQEPGLLQGGSMGPGCGCGGQPFGRGGGRGGPMGGGAMGGGAMGGGRGFGQW